ncbi:hypothetical protein CUMW_283510, partial [Citrus unshiu]
NFCTCVRYHLSKEVNWLAKKQNKDSRGAVVLATLTVVLLLLIPRAAQKSLPQRFFDGSVPVYSATPIVRLRTRKVIGLAQISGAGAFVSIIPLQRDPRLLLGRFGKAQGFIVPIEQFAISAFNIIYLTFETPDYFRKVSAFRQTTLLTKENRGTNCGWSHWFLCLCSWFMPIFSNTQRQTYHVNLRLKFPNRSHSIPG